MLTVYSASEALIEKIKEFEGFRAEAYEDPYRPGLWTIGYGQAIGVKKGDKTTQTSADAWLRAHVGVVSGMVTRLLKVPVNQNQFDAIVDLVYNVGIGRFSASHFLSKLNRADPTASAELLNWDHDCFGHEVEGLKRRRQWEYDRFNTPMAA